VIASAQSGLNGAWTFTFSPSENLHKLIFSEGNEGGLYFRCEPGSGSVKMIHEIGGVDVRTYVPKVEWGGIRVTAPYEVEWEDYGGGVYYIDMVFSSDNRFIKLLPYSSFIQIDASRYPIRSHNEIVLIEEFLRVCAK
jgi:hypothetical protein